MFLGEKNLMKKANMQKVHIPNSDKLVAFYNLDVKFQLDIELNPNKEHNSEYGHQLFCVNTYSKVKQLTSVWIE